MRFKKYGKMVNGTRTGRNQESHCKPSQGGIEDKGPLRSDGDKGRASMIPASKIDRLIGIAIRNCKAELKNDNYQLTESDYWDRLAIFLRNCVLGDVEVKEMENN